jgi:methionyl-tRNA formyltransferase
MRVVILTGADLRHRYFRKALALEPGLEVTLSVCETSEKSIGAVVASESDNRRRSLHLAARDRSEADFFAAADAVMPDKSHPLVCSKGSVNQPECFERIRQAKPDLLLAFGCSILREPLLQAYPGRILNVHLGLSPYYRGSGTNFWPLVNGEPEFVGATFMYIDQGIDTGEIIHQIRPSIVWGDTPHAIGNRLIAEMTPVYAAIARRFDRLGRQQQPPLPSAPRFYRKRDFTEQSVADLYQAFADGLVERYLSERDDRIARAPIVRNPALDAQ